MLQPQTFSPKVLVVDLSNHYGGASSRVLSLMALKTRDDCACRVEIGSDYQAGPSAWSTGA